VLRRVDTLLARGEWGRPICLWGETGSGKTTLVRYWLATNFDAPEERLLSVNRLLLDALKAEGSLDDFAENRSKTRIFGEMALEEALERRFVQANALVLDGLEIALTYDIPVVSLAARHTRRKRIAILCVPTGLGASLEGREYACQIVRLGTPTADAIDANIK
jgi:hypothetical protein